RSAGIVKPAKPPTTGKRNVIQRLRSVVGTEPHRGNAARSCPGGESRACKGGAALAERKDRPPGVNGKQGDIVVAGPHAIRHEGASRHGCTSRAPPVGMNRRRQA